jgi:erythronate-4-phosphate dehydrogenase
LRSEALLINASRGPVIDNRALRSALAGGLGPQAVIDVWENEPQIDHALLRRVYIGTPHIAGYSLDGKLLATRMLRDAAMKFFDCDGPADSLDPQPRPPTIVGDNLHGAELIRHLLLRQYDPRDDDRALRGATLGLHPRIAAGGFDRLRRHYPVRRELRGTVVGGREFNQTDISLLQALGCLELSQHELAS